MGSRGLWLCWADDRLDFGDGQVKWGLWSDELPGSALHDEGPSVSGIGDIPHSGGFRGESWLAFPGGGSVNGGFLKSIFTVFSCGILSGGPGAVDGRRAVARVDADAAGSSGGYDVEGAASGDGFGRRGGCPPKGFGVNYGVFSGSEGDFDARDLNFGQCLLCEEA